MDNAPRRKLQSAEDRAAIRRRQRDREIDEMIKRGERPPTQRETFDRMIVASNRLVSALRALRMQIEDGISRERGSS